MKTEVPLQGFRISAAHPEVHLALFCSQLIAMSYYDKWLCDNKYSNVQILFLFTHMYCTISQILDKVLTHYGYLLWSNIIESSSVFLYLVTVYYAHYFELETLYSDVDICKNNKELVTA